MHTKAIIKTIVALLATGLMSNVNANSVGFDQGSYTGGPIFSLSVIYDFTDFAMFGGGLNIEYDTETIEFVSYTQADLSPDAQAPASPLGSLTQPGLYSGFGIGTFDFFNGMNSAGTIGTFSFAFIGATSGGTSCGGVVCILPNAINPFISLAGQDVTDELIANGLSTVTFTLPVPVPAAAWLLLSGMVSLLGFGRRSN